MKHVAWLGSATAALLLVGASAASANDLGRDIRDCDATAPTFGTIK